MKTNKRALIGCYIVIILLLATSCGSNPLEASEVAIDQTKIMSDNANALLIESASLLYETVEGRLPSDGEITITHELIVEGYLREAPTDPWKESRYYKIEKGKVDPLGTP